MSVQERVVSAARALATWRASAAWAYALLLSLSVAAGRHVVLAGWIAAGVDGNRMTSLTWADAAGVVLATPVVALLVLLLAGWTERASGRPPEDEDPAPASRRQVFQVAAMAGAMLVAWAPYVLTYAPGSVQPDSLYSLAGARTNHHPILFTAIVHSFVRLGESLGDINIGVLAYTAAQCVVMALGLALAISWASRNGAPRWWRPAAVAYFALVPVFPIYAINIQKDPLFSLFVTALTVAMAAVALTHGRTLVRPPGVAGFLGAAALVIFFRNNGIFVFAACVLALAVYRRAGYAAFYASSAALLVATALIMGPGYSALGVTRNTFVESIGIPLQQVAYVVTTGGDVPAEDEAFLSGLLPYEVWREAYTPCLVDSLKWHPQFNGTYLNADRVQFFRTWGSLLKRNPTAYVRAYCLATVGFWKIGANDPYGFADTSVIDNDLGVESTDLFVQLAGTSIKPLLDATRGKSGTGGFVGVGILLWTTLLVGAVLLVRGRGRYVLALVPCLALWATVMIATPVAFSLRYVFAFALCMPGFLLLPFVPNDTVPDSE